jgi:hypothetical protein
VSYRAVPRYNGKHQRATSTRCWLGLSFSREKRRLALGGAEGVQGQAPDPLTGAGELQHRGQRAETILAQTASLYRVVHGHHDSFARLAGAL